MEDTLIGAHQLDANDDGILEILLVDRVHALGLDAGGRPIPGFSMRPGADITAHAVVDYDGDGKERYLLGLADGRILNHRRLGEATPGWRHESKGRAIQAIAHLRAGRKDYLCTVDEKGVVMLLKRSGQRRVRTHPNCTPWKVVALWPSRSSRTSVRPCWSRGMRKTGWRRPAVSTTALHALHAAAEVQLLEAVEARWSRVDGE